MPTPEEIIWSSALDQMEAHLDAVIAALRGEARYPGHFTTPLPSEPLPATMVSRAQLLLIRQQDVEVELRQRTGLLGAFIFGDGRPELQTGVSVDIRS